MPSSVRRLPQRAVGVVRRGVFGGTNRLNLLAVGAIGVGAALVALQLALAGLWFAAVGVLCVGGGLAVIAVKASKAAIFAARAERHLRQGARSGRGASSPPGATAARARLNPAPMQDRLHAIGVFRPEVIDPQSKGRQAAAVREDPQRPYRLYAATVGLQDQAAPESSPSGRRIAVVGTAELAARLGQDFSVTRLHPGLSAAEFEAARPSALVIQEDGLRDGTWYGTLQAGGVQLMRELDSLISQARRQGLMVYDVASETLELSTTTLRRRVSLVVQPGQAVARSGGADLDDAQQPLIDRLSELPGQASPQRQELFS